MNELAKTLNTIPWVSNQTVINPVAVGDKIGRLRARSNIDKCHDYINSLADENGNETEELNNNGLVTYLVDGSYTRRLLIPKGTFLVGKIWKKQRLWVMSFGEMTFVDELGIQRVKAPFERVVEPNSKAIGYMHEDTLIYAISGYESSDLNDIEQELFGENYAMEVLE